VCFTPALLLLLLLFLLPFPLLSLLAEVATLGGHAIEAASLSAPKPAALA
jgi:hypothetical protein